MLSPFARRTLIAAALLLPVVLPIAAHAQDFDIGADARAFAMGGAGLAVSRNQGAATQRYNPASLGFTPHGINIYTPSFGLRSQGPVSSGSIYDYLVNGANIGTATDILRQYTNTDSVFGADASLGFRVGSLEVLADATAKGRILPNAALSSWSNSGQGTLSLPANSEADVLAAGYYVLPSIAYAVKVPTMSAPLVSRYDVAVGARVKVIRSFYSRFIADADTIAGGTDALKAPELNGKDYLDKTGVAADAGILLRPKAGKGINYALVVNNLVNPSPKFTAINPAGYQGRTANGQQFDLLQTTVSVGTAYEAGGLTLAADLMDISSATRPADLRLGGEQTLGPWFALRAGYSSNSGLTLGVGLFGLDVAVAQRLPLEIYKSIRF